jgi:hypothetical protein
MSINEIFDLIVSQRVGKAYNAIVAKVLSVDLNEKVCDVRTLEGVSIFDVRLLPSASNGFLIAPTVDSFVLVHMISDHDYYVTMCSQFDKIDFGDGSFGGLTKIDALVTKINNLETALNKVITALNSWVVVPSDGGAALKAVVSAQALINLTVTQKSELENTKIKHGV